MWVYGPADDLEPRRITGRSFRRYQDLKEMGISSGLKATAVGYSWAKKKGGGKNEKRLFGKAPKFFWFPCWDLTQKFPAVDAVRSSSGLSADIALEPALLPRAFAVCWPWV
jgi:hypothetical protein